jgi:hypothetical protein
MYDVSIVTIVDDYFVRFKEKKVYLNLVFIRSKIITFYKSECVPLLRMQGLKPLK